MLNIQGFLRSKFNEIMHNIALRNYDFICLCETWLQTGVPDVDNLLPKYNCVAHPASHGVSAIRSLRYIAHSSLFRSSLTLISPMHK